MKLLFLILFALSACFIAAEDFYDILEITKQANEREIRKAFKKKALQLHPDKNMDDPDAQANFIKLNRAYEVLKDEELRKKYDLYGEKGLDDSGSHGNKYHSWSYYRDNFGIYDDDVEIITLNGADFEQSVLGSSDVWFINFYHPMCSHCHTLAPVWRKIAQELDGVARIGAVNCDDTFHLCSTQGIRSYPMLVAYPGRVSYYGAKTREGLLDFLLARLRPTPFLGLGAPREEWGARLAQCSLEPWLVVARPQFEEDEDEFALTKIKLGAIFENLLCLGEVDCSEESPSSVCASLELGASEAKFFSTEADLRRGQGTPLQSTNPQELAREVLALLPDVPLLSAMQYQAMREEVQRSEEEDDAPPWLVVFTDRNDDPNLEIRKLPAYLPSFSLGRVRCSEDLQGDCDALFISKTPAFVLFKAGGGYEMHQGRSLAHDIAVFAREGALATQFQVLTPREFPQVLSDGSAWFVDFYAPWCPPCMKLLPEFRKASRLVDAPVKFGSIDCTTHASLCLQFNIQQYPTTILYNRTVPHPFHGYHSASQLVDFVKDTLQPTVIVLSAETYEERVASKPAHELWVVDYYTNWCGHCLEMAPEYRKFARLVADIPDVFVAQIDCAVHRHVCQRDGVTGYPTVKLFPVGQTGTRGGIKFGGWSRDAASFRQWLQASLPSKVAVLDDRTFEQMLRGDRPWIVDFYAPWCGPCHHFAPHFEEIATQMEGQVSFGKVDCEVHRGVCKGAGVRAYPTLKWYAGVAGGEARQDVRGEDLNTLHKEDVVAMATSLLRRRERREEAGSHDEL